MPKHKIIVLTAPIAGREQEYNDWYNAVHIKDVVAVPGIASGQRFKVSFSALGEFPSRYIAIYDLDSDRPEDVIASLSERSGTPQMELSDALNMSANLMVVLEACSDVVVSAE